MTVDAFVRRFVAGEIRSPFMVSRDGKSILDADGVVIQTFETPKDTFAYVEKLTKAVRERVAKVRKAHKPLSGLDEFVKPL